MISVVATVTLLLVGPISINAGTTRLKAHGGDPQKSEISQVESSQLFTGSDVDKTDSERACTPGNIVIDGGFETTSGSTFVNPSWPSTSTQFGTPFCNVAGCGTGGTPTTAAPRTGTFWSWLGGTTGTGAEVAQMNQSVTFPDATASSVTLNFYLWIGAVTTPFTDTMVVQVDNVTQMTFTEPTVAEVGYTQRSINLTSFANGASHNIKFLYTQPSNGGTSNYSVDDVTLDVVCGAPATAKDSIGAVSSGCFFLRNTNNGGPANTTACYGLAGQIPLAGDWNNDGTDTIGVYDQASGTFLLRNTNTPGTADITVQFGAIGASSVPIVGDWNGDGTDSIGIYDNVTGAFFLKNANTPGSADFTFQFGVGGPNIYPVAGDWDNNGTDTVGTYNNTNCVLFLRNTNAAGSADITFCFGPAGAGFRPLNGDWDNNGTDGIGIYDTSTGGTFLRNALTNGPADTTFTFGTAGMTPVAGDWDNLP